MIVIDELAARVIPRPEEEEHSFETLKRCCEELELRTRLIAAEREIQVLTALLHRLHAGYGAEGHPVLTIIGPDRGGRDPVTAQIEPLPRGQATGLLLCWEEEVRQATGARSRPSHRFASFGRLASAAAF